MATLNVSLPGYLKDWVAHQVDEGKYSSASDYLRDLIRKDIRHQEHEIQVLANYLNPLSATPNEQFVTTTTKDVKNRARKRIKSFGQTFNRPSK